MRPDGTPTSQAFTDEEMSVDRASKRTPQKSQAESPKCGLVSFPVELATRLNQTVEEDPKLWNPAHCLVKGKKSKGTQRAFAAESVWVIPPPPQVEASPTTEEPPEQEWLSAPPQS